MVEVCAYHPADFVDRGPDVNQPLTTAH